MRRCNSGVLQTNPPAFFQVSSLHPCMCNLIVILATTARFGEYTFILCRSLLSPCHSPVCCLPLPDASFVRNDRHQQAVSRQQLAACWQATIPEEESTQVLKRITNFQRLVQAEPASPEELVEMHKPQCGVLSLSSSAPSWSQLVQ